MDSNKIVYSLNQVSTAFKKSAEEFCPGFLLDDIIKPTFRLLCLYFANDPRFEEDNNFKLAKGIGLFGNVGVGKTILMQACRINPRMDFTVVSTPHLSDIYQEEGIEGLKRFAGISSSSGEPQKAFCFDDLGCEPTSSKYMGNEMNVMQRIILSRYEKKIPFNYTHFTSNLSSDEISELYGIRTKSRLREMCNVIVLPGEDRRS